jgi:YfiH family protein
MLRRKQGDVEWLEFELLQDIPDLVHGVFLRHGGFSAEPYASLNVGGAAGDDLEVVRRNREKIGATLGLDNLVLGFQRHRTRVVAVPAQDAAELEDCDGLCTQQKGMGLLVQHADCQAAIFYDPINHAIANVHAGWRGNVQNIYKEAVDVLCKTAHSKPENLLVGISPSLGPQASEFKNYQVELPESFLPFQIKPTYFDLWAISRSQLEACGILPHHLEIASICTYSNPEDFFSYRREKKSGRHATVVALR